MTSINNFTKGLQISLFVKKHNKSYDGEVIMIDTDKNKVQVKIGDKLVLTPMKYLTIKKEDKSIHDCFLLNMLCDDIMDIVLNEKKYMDKKYIMKMLSKDDIKYCMSGPLNKARKRITYFDVASKPKLIQMVDDWLVPAKSMNPTRLSENMYFSYLFKEKVMEIEDKKKIKKPNHNHKYKLGDILFKPYGDGDGYGTSFFKIVKLTPQGYTLEPVRNYYTETGGWNDGWSHDWCWIDINNPKTNYMSEEDRKSWRYKSGERPKKLTYRGDKDLYLVKDLIEKLDKGDHAYIKKKEFYGVVHYGYNYYTLDLMR